MVLFEPLGHVCDPRYLKPTILAFLGTPRLAENSQFWVFCQITKRVQIWSRLVNGVLIINIPLNNFEKHVITLSY